MRQLILEQCRKSLNKFSKMSDTDIYNYICDNFYITDYNEAMECSLLIFKESRQ